MGAKWENREGTRQRVSKQSVKGNIKTKVVVRNISSLFSDPKRERRSM